jgi:UDP-N-acetylglucosamine 2-epimerase (non-hydrolysing)
MRRFGLDADSTGVRFTDVFGLLDFIALQRSARCIPSNSGTVQVERCILGVPNVTIRDVTERPETVECGINILSGTDADAIGRTVHVVLEQKPRWRVPPEYPSRT